MPYKFSCLLTCSCVVGMTKLIESVDTVVRDVLGATSLKDSMTLSDIRDLVCEVRRRVETEYVNGSIARTTRIYRFMLPEPDSTADDAAEVSISHCVGLCVNLWNNCAVFLLIGSVLDTCKCFMPPCPFQHCIVHCSCFWCCSEQINWW